MQGALDMPAVVTVSTGHCQQEVDLSEYKATLFLVYMHV